MPNEFIKPEYLDAIARLRLIDDFFMRKAFENNIPAAELLLRIILQNDKIKVLEARSQYAVHNLYGHSVQLDVLAKDANGKYFNVEVQSASEGASPQRARYYGGVVDTAHFPKNTDYRKLFETYVIFITQKDVLGEGRPIYHIERKIEESGNSFCDGSHIIYVNGEIRNDNTALSRLMHDFFCAKASDMYYWQLQKRIKYLKETEEGVQTMCKIIDDLSGIAFAKGKNEGFAQGEAKGRSEGKSEGLVQGEERFALLLQKLYALGRAEDAKRVSEDKAYRNTLMKEFAIQ